MHKLLFGLLFSCLSTLAFGQFSLSVGTGYYARLDGPLADRQAILITPAYNFDEHFRLGLSIGYLSSIYTANSAITFDPNIPLITQQAYTYSTVYTIPIEIHAQYTFGNGRIRPLFGATVGLWQQINRFNIEYAYGYPYSFESGTSYNKDFTFGAYVGASYDFGSQTSVSLQAGYLNTNSYDHYLPIRVEFTYRFNKQAAAK